MDVEQSNGQPANVIDFFFDMSVLEKCIITRSAKTRVLCLQESRRGCSDWPPALIQWRCGGVHVDTRHHHPSLSSVLVR